ncbi:MAG: IclR family transcriptional regulator [Syntrophomonadaceae bacterium]|jgi:IclR family KDG regulon transcriptional repressor
MDSPIVVKTIDKALSIIELFLDKSEPLSAVEIHRALNIPKPTVSRLTRVLEYRGYLTKTENNKYWLGSKILQLASIINEQLELATLARPIVKELRDCTHQTVHLNIIEKFERVCIYCLQGKGDVRGYMVVGQRSPLHIGASAKLLLAFNDDRFINEYIEQYKLSDKRFGLINSNELWADIHQIREKGYCVTIKQRTRDGIGISAPIREVSGRVIAAVTITAPATRIDMIDCYIAKVMEAASEISSLLGYTNKKTGAF